MNTPREEAVRRIAEIEGANMNFERVLGKFRGVLDALAFEHDADSPRPELPTSLHDHDAKLGFMALMYVRNRLNLKALEDALLREQFDDLP